MKNKLTDLNNHLFEMLERLNDEDLTDDELNDEIKRGKAMTAVANAIIRNGTLQLQVIKHVDEQGRSTTEFPDVLQIENNGTKS